MNIKRCDNGHVFNGAMYNECPYCKGGAKVNVGGDKSTSKDFNSRSHGNSYEGNSRNRAVDNVMEDDDKTMAFWNSGMELDPVVGWLICIHGQDKGKDFKIKSEKNFIGRSEDMDICISGDRSISRRNHCIISYNPKQRNFMMMPGDGTGIVYVDGEAVYTPRTLDSFMSIEIGESKFVFVALCGENFDWKLD